MTQPDFAEAFAAALASEDEQYLEAEHALLQIPGPPAGLTERLSDDDPVARLLAQAVLDLNTLLSPFLPFTANQIDVILGGAGDLQPLPRIEQVADLDLEDRSYPVITGDYAGIRSWGRHDVTVGTPIEKPTPVFTKLDPSVVEEELSR